MAEDKTALVLSGGGSNGAVEVGFYKALWEYGVRVDVVIGTSVGAINGAMIASGLTPYEMHDRWDRTRRRDLLRLNWPGLLRHGIHARSLFSGSHFRKFLEWGIPARRFEDLKIPFVAIATDLGTGDAVAMEGGDLLPAVQASCALPAIFPPVVIDGRQYADGGLSRMVPIDAAIERGAQTTFVALAECRHDARMPVRGMLGALSRSFSVANSGLIRAPGYLELFSLRTRVILFEPCFRIPIAPKHLFDLENTDVQVKFGYEYAMAKLEQEGFGPPTRSPEPSGTMAA